MEKIISTKLGKNIELILKQEGTSKRDVEFFKQIYGIGCEQKSKKEIANESNLSYQRILQIQKASEFKLTRYFHKNSHKIDFLCYD